jgi:hypothetical protein
MAKNKQLSFPLDPQSYTAPYDSEYDKKLQKMHFGDSGQRINEVQEELRRAADAVSNCFSWEDTVEGMNFWAHACDALYSMSDELVRRQDPDGEQRIMPPPGGYVPDFDEICQQNTPMPTPTYIPEEE